MSNTPQIRFAGFTDAWEQRKLRDIGETYTGLSGKTKEDFGHGDAKFVTYMNVFSNSIADSAMTESVEIDKGVNLNDDKKDSNGFLSNCCSQYKVLNFN